MSFSRNLLSVVHYNPPISMLCDPFGRFETECFYEHAKQCESTCHLGKVGGGGGGGNILGKKGFFGNNCQIKQCRGWSNTGTFIIEATELIWGHWRLFGGQRSLNRVRKHNRGSLAACLGCLSKAACPKLLVQSCFSKDACPKLLKLNKIDFV